MKTLSTPLLSVLFVLFSILGNAQDFYGTQYFDGNDTIPRQTIQITLSDVPEDIWQIGKPSKTLFHSAASKPNALLTDTANHLPNNNQSYFTLGVPIPEDGTLFYYAVAIQWMQKLDLEKGTDLATLEYSTDGITWENTFDSPYIYNRYGWNEENVDTLNGQIGFSGTDTTWRNVWTCFDMYWLDEKDTLIMRYGLLSGDSEAQREGWITDNFYLQETFIHTITETEITEKYTVSPNPSSGKVQVQMKKKTSQEGINNLLILDINGKVLREYGRVPARTQLNLSDLPKGTYFIKIQSTEGEVTKQLILE